MALLSLSHISANLIIHKFDNIITRIFYLLSAVWLGILVCFLIVIFFSSILLITANLLGFSINLKIAGLFIILLSLAWSSFNYINSRQLNIKELEISIKNLPARWENKKIVQISDVHLGVIHGMDYMEKIVDKTNSLSPEAVFITGDLFDGAGDNLARSVSPLNNLSSRLGTYFITGNHETYLGKENTKKALSGINITELKDRVVDLNGISLIGINYILRGEQKNIKDILDKADMEKPKILLLHEPIKVDYFRESGINLMLSGHTHRGQMWPFNYITKQIYKGYDYGLHTMDDFNIYTTNGAGTWGPPFRSMQASEIVSITLKRK